MPKKSANTPEHVYTDRIVGFAYVSPGDLLANPHNWRVHPDSQREAMEAMLRSKGWGGVVIVNQPTGHILDGHMRTGIALQTDQPTVPVVYLDIPESEEPEFIVTFDTIGDMATPDRAKLMEALSLVTSAEDAVSSLLEDLREQAMDALIMPVQPTEAAYAVNPFVEKFANDPNRQPAESVGDPGPVYADLDEHGEPVGVGGVRTGDTVIVPPSLNPESPRAPAALRSVQMLLPPDDHDRLMANLKRLANVYQTVSVTETVMRAVELAAAALPAEPVAAVAEGGDAPDGDS